MARILALILVLLLAFTCAAEGFAFPADLTEIRDEAFMADESITSITLPDGVTAIGARAFAQCSNLRTAYVPASVETIGEDAFFGAADAFLLTTEPGSAAMEYALQNQIDLRADTTFRALLVGQKSYYPYAQDLNSSVNDVNAIEGMLNRSDADWSITKTIDLASTELSSAIASTFAGAQPQDISLFYYTGHGSFYGEDEPDPENPDEEAEIDDVAGGRLLFSDGYTVTPARLRTLLDAVPGRKIVVIDACYSGGVIAASLDLFEDYTEPYDEFVADFMMAFGAGLFRASALNADPYFVMTSCRSSQTSVVGEMNGMEVSLFSFYLAKGSGYDVSRDATTAYNADMNNDGAITLNEIYNYAGYLSYSWNNRQTAQVYPLGCDWFAFTRIPGED